MPKLNKPKISPVKFIYFPDADADHWHPLEGEEANPYFGFIAEPGNHVAVKDFDNQEEYQLAALEIFRTLVRDLLRHTIVVREDDLNEYGDLVDDWGGVDDYHFVPTTANIGREGRPA